MYQKLSTYFFYVLKSVEQILFGVMIQVKSLGQDFGMALLFHNFPKENFEIFWFGALLTL